MDRRGQEGSKTRPSPPSRPRVIGNGTGNGASVAPSPYMNPYLPMLSQQTAASPRRSGATLQYPASSQNFFDAVPPLQGPLNMVEGRPYTIPATHSSPDVIVPQSRNPQTHITISEDRSMDSQFSRQILSALLSKDVNSGEREYLLEKKTENSLVYHSDDDEGYENVVVPGSPHQTNSLLIANGINPQSLTPSQFAAFQSQTPAVQKKSLQVYTQNLARHYKSANHALQDHQTQMMALEHQNKKILMMARQEQDVNGPGEAQAEETTSIYQQPQRLPKNSTPKSTDKAVPVTVRDSFGSDPFELPFGSTSTSYSDRGPTSSHMEPDPSSICSPSLASEHTAFSKVVEEHGSNTNTVTTKQSEVKPASDTPDSGEGRSVTEADVQRLRDYIEELELANQRYRSKQEQWRPRPPRWQVLHRISNQEHSTFFDHPSWVPTANESKFLQGKNPVSNLPLYLEKNKDISFIVYKDFDENDEAASSSDHSDPNCIRLPTPCSESVHPVSASLSWAIDFVLQLRGKFAGTLDSSQLVAPYLFFYHSRDDHSSLVSTMPEQSREEFNLLSQYIYKYYGEEYAIVDELLDRGHISATYTGYLFRPNDVLVSISNDPPMAFVATSWPRFDGVADAFDDYAHELGEMLEKAVPGQAGNECPNKELRKVQRWMIKAWSWLFDGAFHKRDTSLNFEVPVTNESEIAIEELSVCPMRFVKEEVKALLQERGETFWKCRFRRFVSYSGDDVDDLHNAEGDRYMIDMSAYKKLHPTSSLNDHIGSEKDRIGSEKMARDDPPDGDFLLLLPPKIKGYNLRRKKWLDLKADLISDVKWNKLAFKSLVVDDETKELIQALVTNQLAAERATDLISGKGNGLIILLHGGPGTGKTLTAESVAEIAEKPLYRVTCGDIGTQPEAVEKYLESVLHLGKLWECGIVISYLHGYTTKSAIVVLLDEADVFLEQRTLSDLQRNALVSVFLRVLEYYEGILILTSNRVGTFDEAFKSRIQLALHYENLTSSQRRKIWRNFVTRLQDLEEPNINFDDIFDHMDDLAKEEMNGRQIRNAITTARQLAQYKSVELRYQHLRHVIGVAGKFDQYLKKVNEGLSDDQIARDDRVR